MRTLRHVTNLELAYALLWVALLITMVIGWKLFDGVQSPVVFVFITVGAAAILLTLFVIVNLRLRKSPTNFWLQPASERVGKMIANCVVAIWLCMVATLLLLILAKQETPVALGILLLFAIAGIGLGKYLKRVKPNDTLLPYGISFLVTLLATLIALLALKALK